MCKYCGNSGLCYTVIGYSAYFIISRVKRVLFWLMNKKTGAGGISLRMMKRINIFLIVLIFFCSILAVSFHHHEDSLCHEDCPLCIAGIHNAGFINQNYFEITPHYDAPDRVLIEADCSPHSDYIQSFFGRAPPA